MALFSFFIKRKKKNDVKNDAIKLYLKQFYNYFKRQLSIIIVGKLDALLRTGIIKKLIMVIGQSYFYETEGILLKKFDGNHLLKGSAGSVGQGGSETLVMNF